MKISRPEVPSFTGSLPGILYQRGESLGRRLDLKGIGENPPTSLWLELMYPSEDFVDF